MLSLRLCTGLRAGQRLQLVATQASVCGGVRSMSGVGGGQEYKFETLAVTQPRENVFVVKLNRPNKMNAMNRKMWIEVGQCFNTLADDDSCRAIILGAEGKLFTAGLDLMEMAKIAAESDGDGEADVARKGRNTHRLIKEFQDSFSALEKCPKPVIAAIHGACVGGGVDLVCGADIRFFTSDAWFQIKEVELGLAADVGTLQRFPKIVGSQSLVRELVFTARKVFSAEALQCGFTSRTFDSKESLESGALEVATQIASKSPVAVQTSKIALIHARDHSVDEGLDYIARMNSLMLQSDDLRIAAMALMSKGETKAEFSKY